MGSGSARSVIGRMIIASIGEFVSPFCFLFILGAERDWISKVLVEYLRRGPYRSTMASRIQRYRPCSHRDVRK